MRKIKEYELQKLVEKISCDYFNAPFNHTVTLNQRLRTTGGRYLLASHNIEINPKIIENYDKGVLIGVIKHELCHYHLHINHKGYQHRNTDFKLLLKKVNGLRYAPATLNTKIKVVYECIKCKKQYPRRRHINTDHYCCSNCGGKLKIIQEHSN